MLKKKFKEKKSRLECSKQGPSTSTELVFLTSLKIEKCLFLAYIGKLILQGSRSYISLSTQKFSGTFLRGSPFIQLGNETTITKDELQSFPHNIWEFNPYQNLLL